jgi:hypothetical protein
MPGGPIYGKNGKAFGTLGFSRDSLNPYFSPRSYRIFAEKVKITLQPFIFKVSDLAYVQVDLQNLLGPIPLRIIKSYL